MEFGIDIAKGCKLAIAEMYGDWYRDPWGWPEYMWLDSKPSALNIQEFVRRERGSFSLTQPAFFHMIEVPKNRLAVRPAVIQDSLSRLLYVSSSASSLKQLHSDLPDWVYGWRLREGDRLSSNRLEWAQYLEAIPSHLGSDFGLQVDISSFFASINADRMADLLYQRLGKTGPASILADVIRQHDSLSTRSGIPQRSFSSAILAHLYLSPVDDSLRSAARTARAVTRWMDDITVFGSEEDLYRIYLDLQDRIRQLGLEPNAAKTRLADAKGVSESLRHEGMTEIQIPRHVKWAASGAPTTVEDLAALDRTEEIVLDGPEKFSRTWLRALLASLSQYKRFKSFDKWVAVAHKLPYAADSLGRYFREAMNSEGSGRDRCDQLTEWFCDLCSRPWGRLDWVVSQLGLAFPAGMVSSELSGVLTQWLSTGIDAQKVAIAAQRLATRSPSDCRDIIRSRVDKVSDPVLLRILGLGLLQAGDSRAAVRPIMERDRRNHLVQTMLEDRNWQHPKVAADFDSAVVDDLE
jgi:hypothetical protein